MKEKTRGLLFILILLVLFGAWTLYRGHAYRRQADALPDDSIVGQGKPVLLELGAPWCTYCRQMMPILTDFNENYPQFRVAVVDIDEDVEARQRYEVGPIPLLLFFDAGGELLYRREGYMSKEQILAKWRELGVPAEQAG